LNHWYCHRSGSPCRYNYRVRVTRGSILEH
jgi:hypothetical protein